MKTATFEQGDESKSEVIWKRVYNWDDSKEKTINNCSHHLAEMLDSTNQPALCVT